MLEQNQEVTYIIEEFVNFLMQKTACFYLK